MKILHFYKRSITDSNGGVEVFIDNLCTSLTKYGIKSNVLTISPNPSKRIITKEKNYKIYLAKENLYLFSTSFSLNSICIFNKLINEADIVHFHYPYPFADFLNLINYKKKPTIITYHSDIVRQKKIEKFYKPLRDNFLNSADKIISTSPNYFATSECLQKYSDKVEVIPISISENKYKFKESAKKLWSKKLNYKFFLFLGSYRYYKGLKWLIEAVRNTNINLVLAGETSYDLKIIKYIGEENINNIKILGSVSHEDKCALLSLCYGFVFPSDMRSEAFGISLLEASVFSKPLISCEIGTGTSFVNIHNETGLVVTPGNSKALYEAMKFLLNNPKTALKMGLNSYKRVKEHFNEQNESESYYNIYKKIYKE